MVTMLADVDPTGNVISKASLPSRALKFVLLEEAWTTEDPGASERSEIHSDPIGFSKLGLMIVGEAEQTGAVA